MLSKSEELKDKYFSNKETIASPERAFAEALIKVDFLGFSFAAEGSSFSVYPYIDKESDKPLKEECFKVKLTYIASIASESGTKPAKEEAEIIFKIGANKAEIISCSSDVIYEIVKNHKSYKLAVEEAQSKAKSRHNFTIFEMVIAAVTLVFSLYGIGLLGGGVTVFTLLGLGDIGALAAPLGIMGIVMGTAVLFAAHQMVKDFIMEDKAVDAITSKEDVGKELGQELLNPLDNVPEFSYHAVLQSNVDSPVLWKEQKDSENFHSVENKGLEV